MLILEKTGEDRVRYLLQYLGSQNYAKFYDLNDDIKVYELKYDTLKGKLEDLYEVKVVEIAECYKFQCRKQGQGESIQEYVTALKKISSNLWIFEVSKYSNKASSCIWGGKSCNQTETSGNRQPNLR